MARRKRPVPPAANTPLAQDDEVRQVTPADGVLKTLEPIQLIHWMPGRGSVPTVMQVDVEPVNSAIASVTDPKNSVEPVAATLFNANQMDPIEIAKAQAKSKATMTEQPGKGDYH
ncbi:hypothetical protein K7X08_032450 [Anisodus acutangulus]|uniref:Uncharacterized protein n=1 Tax=Anisodus acutangulus TaxID=402998 RepID=A0A9Q1MVM5_9SOLA|nr:hypothetical protein K7X08_032450 [Anisodus acutangulus]